MRILQALEQAGLGGLTAEEAREKVGGTKATVAQLVSELHAVGCLRRVGAVRGEIVYELGKARFSRYLAAHAVRVRDSDLASVEKAALAASMQFVRAWPKATDAGRQQTVVRRLLRHLARLRA